MLFWDKSRKGPLLILETSILKKLFQLDPLEELSLHIGNKKVDF